MFFNMSIPCNNLSYFDNEHFKVCNYISLKSNIKFMCLMMMYINMFTFDNINK